LRRASPGFRALRHPSDRDLFFQGRLTTWQLTRQAALASKPALLEQKDPSRLPAFLLFPVL
jgi:hypothetical protein